MDLRETQGPDAIPQTSVYTRRAAYVHLTHSLAVRPVSAAMRGLTPSHPTPQTRTTNTQGRRVATALNSARRRRFDGAANGELSAGYPEISRIASELEPSPFRRRRQWHNCRGAKCHLKYLRLRSQASMRDGRVSDVDDDEDDGDSGDDGDDGDMLVCAVHGACTVSLQRPTREPTPRR
ncbi:hypothetical protein ALC56_04597 [Trachymyrmex septentrionalis]|uniref:Uncharacterized protein n=1 Tax=Trachymyrmex septentrionalis TaxID=34720 RepID=A0A195FLY9_9HYME|nr:hypothetical protein ALC56_04597 [Trachymyrmex septentrionalis]